MNTSGHLSSNGGVRGHSAGDFFPFRVVVKGELDSLQYWVVSPTGEELDWYLTAGDACYAASRAHGQWYIK